MQHLALFLPDNRSKLIPWNIPTVTRRAERKQKAFLHIACTGICPILLVKLMMSQTYGYFSFCVS